MSTRKAWSKLVEQPAQEFPLTNLPVLTGKIPQGLRGSLYRNGPGRLARGEQKVGHWFDGDGGILGVHFSDEGAKATYRYVQTSGYLAEAKANRFLFPNYGMNVPGHFWQSWGKPLKNTANTSVLALADRLLALWEAGLPHGLDLYTLDTIGIDQLSSLNPKDNFSAHPKIDQKTGEIFNFGVTIGAQTKLHLYVINSLGEVQRRGEFTLEGVPLIHDFVLAGPYLIFFVPPVRTNTLPVLLGLKCYSEVTQWQPQFGTKILIFDRESLTLVSQGEAEPWYQWHFVNGTLEQDGLITVDFVRFSDFTTNQYLQEFAFGQIDTPAKGTLWRVRLNPQTAKVVEQYEWLDRSCEFPLVPPHQVGNPWRYTFMSIERAEGDNSKDALGAIARFDCHTGELTVADQGSNGYPSEPIFVPHQMNSEQGWVLTLVYNGNEGHSEIKIYDSDRLSDEPLCSLGLPQAIPLGFHGTWRQDGE